jgi:hypothetical protein
LETRYKVTWTRGQVSHESAPMPEHDAHNLAREKMKGNRAVTVLKESDGSDHPANRGKWFLDRIFK